MARDRASIRVDMWADGDYRRLSFCAQWLYMLLLSHPTLSYVGVADWRPGRIAALSETTSAEDVQLFAEELQASRFILVDEDTEEVLVRSFIKHDGLLKQPKLTVSMCKAFAATASEKIRRVIAFEVQKLRDSDPELRAWGVDQVRTILDAEADSIEVFTLDATHEVTQGFTPGFTLNGGQGLGLPTSTATSTATPLQVMGGTPAQLSASPPPAFCKRHESTEGTDHPCRGCKIAGQKYEAFMSEQASPERPFVHEHKWFPDGTCLTCDERREVA